MTATFAINGFGRIGRLVFRAWLESGRKDCEIVAINDLAPLETNAHLLQYDSVHGRLPYEVTTEGNDILKVNGHKVKVYSQRNLEDIPRTDNGVDVVLECTGIFTKKEDAGKHLNHGAKKVLISDLQKTQQARNLMFGFTRDTIDHMYGPGDLLVIWLPFAMIIDTALLPFTFVGSLLTGF